MSYVTCFGKKQATSHKADISAFTYEYMTNMHSTRQNVNNKHIITNKAHTYYCRYVFMCDSFYNSSSKVSLVIKREFHSFYMAFHQHFGSNVTSVSLAFN